MIKLSLALCDFDEEGEYFVFNCPVCDAEELILDVSNDNYSNLVTCYDCNEVIELTYEITDEDVDKLF